MHNRSGLRMKMVRIGVFKIIALLSLSAIFPVIQGWGVDGHLAICKIAQSRLSEAAAEAVKNLLPESAENDLASVCSWADRVKFRYHWSSPLHFIDTPDNLCTYRYSRDCKDEKGEKDRCVAGAINNYTTQLLSYNSAASQAEYNLTEALLFLSHFMGDIHQPLHVGFTSDRGGNTIDVHWYTRKQVLHHVWDDNIIETAEQKLYDSNIDGLIDAIQHNITTEWVDLVKRWETCSTNMTTCPDKYASEGIKAACDWAYKGVSEGSTLEGKQHIFLSFLLYIFVTYFPVQITWKDFADDYFYSRLPIVYLRLAQGGVRLAATLNRIFG